MQNEMAQPTVIAERAHLNMVPLFVEFITSIVVFTLVYIYVPLWWLGIFYLAILVGMAARLLYLFAVNLLPRVLITQHGKALTVHKKKPITLRKEDVMGVTYRNNKDFNIFTTYFVSAKYTYGRLYITAMLCGKKKKIVLRHVKFPSRVVDTVYDVLGFRHVE